MRKELLKGLNEEQLEKASHCKNSEELLALAKQEGVELTDEQLSAVSGGACVETSPKRNTSACPQCGAMANGVYEETTPGDGHYHYVCLNCSYEWNEK